MQILHIVKPLHWIMGNYKQGPGARIYIVTYVIRMQKNPTKTKKNQQNK